jgi:hypothetical protein
MKFLYSKNLLKQENLMKKIILCCFLYLAVVFCQDFVVKETFKDNNCVTLDTAIAQRIGECVTQNEGFSETGTKTEVFKRSDGQVQINSYSLQNNCQGQAVSSVISDTQCHNTASTSFRFSSGADYSFDNVLVREAYFDQDCTRNVVAIVATHEVCQLSSISGFAGVAECNLNGVVIYHDALCTNISNVVMPFEVFGFSLDRCIGGFFSTCAVNYNINSASATGSPSFAKSLIPSINLLFFFLAAVLFKFKY